MPFRYIQLINNKQFPGNHRRIKRVLFDSISNFQTIPQAPTTEIINQIKDFQKNSTFDISGHLLKLKQLFEKQPVWSRLPIINNLLKEEHAFLKMTLPM